MQNYINLNTNNTEIKGPPSPQGAAASGDDEAHSDNEADGHNNGSSGVGFFSTSDDDEAMETTGWIAAMTRREGRRGSV